MDLKFTGGFDQGATYWVNDLYNGTSSQVMGSDLASFSVNLSSYSSAIYTISTREEMVILPPLPPIVSVEDELASAPNSYRLEQNYPNPFNPATTIRYSVVKSDNVAIKIYDVLGREVKTLVNEFKENGNFQVTWNGENNFGYKVNSGIYFYRIETGLFVDTKKMILLK
ncbi:MAG: T9SS type A sorting domain-containing protein [Ignavibacteriaceae bacterium]